MTRPMNDGCWSEEALILTVSPAEMKALIWGANAAIFDGELTGGKTLIPEK